MFILEEASLSFLGLGVPLEVPTWGNILNAAQDMFTLQNNWWMWLPTGIVAVSYTHLVQCWYTLSSLMW